MRYVVAIIGTVVSIGLIIVSVMMNFRFGQMLGKTEFDGIIYGIASGSADGFKVILPFCAVWAWRNKRFVAASVSSLLFVIFTCYSLMSSLGFSATNRAEVSGERAKIANDYKDIRAGYRRTVKRREALPNFRPIGTVQGFIRAAQQNRRWTSTQQCTDATVGASRQFCDNYFRLKAELGTAKDAKKLDIRIEKLRDRLDQFIGGAATQGRVDPQVQILKDISGLAENRVEMALTIVLSLLVELGSGFGLFVTFGHGHGSRKEDEDTSPSYKSPVVQNPLVVENATLGDVDWARTCLEKVAGGLVSATELYENYLTFYRDHHLDEKNAMTQTTFGKWLTEGGFKNKRKINGKIFYEGLRLKTASSEKVVPLRRA